MIVMIDWKQLQNFLRKQSKIYFENLEPQLHHLGVNNTLPGTSNALANTQETFFWTIF